MPGDCPGGMGGFGIDWYIMTNWKTEFHKPLTRPGVKHDEEMSIILFFDPSSSQGVHKFQLAGK